jgi:Rho GTPase-activating protein 39
MTESQGDAKDLMNKVEEQRSSQHSFETAGEMLAAVEEVKNDSPPMETADAAATKSQNLRTPSLADARPLSDIDPNSGKPEAPKIDMEALKTLETTGKPKPKFNIEDIVEERKCGWIFKRKYSTEKLMQWGGSLPGKMALISDLEEKYDRLAVKVFTNIQKAMGDKRPGNSRVGILIREILEIGLIHPSMRDEIYLQVKKQVTNNPTIESTRKGWQLFCGLTMAFTPSKTMEAYVRDDISETANNPDTDKQITKIAAYVLMRFNRRCQTGPGTLPIVEDIERTLNAPFHPSAFGNTLDEIMRHPELIDETKHYPKVLIFLSEAVLNLGGCQTEGIFRVPGDHEYITRLRLRIEKGDYNLPENVRDPAIPASLLKLWLRDLAEPLIPNDFYDRAIANANNVEGAISVLDDLPIHNLHVAKYMIKFLQVIGDARYQPATKMTVSNLAMVFAPNFLRCPSEDPLVILRNSKVEQNFIKTLINYLEA